MARVLAFRVGDSYLFDRYFEREYLFEALAEYYDEETYRFELPVEALADVQQRLSAAGIELAAVDDPAPYCVVIDRYEPHSDILEQAVAAWTRRNHRFCLMNGDRALAAALDAGARRVTDTEFVAGL